MAEVITMLALSPTMEEGTIADWLKKEGDSVEEGELIAEIETDKATMEMESFFEGVILKVLVKAGDTVKVGAPMAVVGEEGEDADAAIAALGGAAPAASNPAKAPKDADDEGEEDEEAEDEAKPKKKSKAKTKAKAKKAKPAQDEPEDDDASEDEPEGDSEEEEEEEEVAQAASSQGRRLKVSPVARRIADEASLKLAGVEGTGPGGRIIKRDVEQAIADAKAKPKAAKQAKAKPEAAPAAGRAAGASDLGVIGELPDAGGEAQPLSQMRKAIARRLTQVWQATPHFYLTMAIDMAPLMAQREAINAQLAAAGEQAKLSVNDLIVKASALALKRYPRMNVSYQGDSLHYFEQAHIGVAVAIEDGLITPTIRDADLKSLTRISQETRELAKKARDKKLKPHEFGGSTFTISNLGMYGIEDFCAVINPPESAILACGAVQQVPIVRDGQLAVGTVMKVTLSCDHRAVDGAVGAEFLQHLKQLLEHPVLLMV